MSDGYEKTRPGGPSRPRQKKPRRPGSLEEINVHVLENRSRPRTHGSTIYEGPEPKLKPNTNYIYVNQGYTGSVSSLSTSGPNVVAPPTGVVREQYWACAKWPRAQRFLAIAVGVLAGAVIGLTITIGLRAADKDHIIGPIFRKPVPN